ncbi:MAG: alcohol dehydrogenase catalytic domain-containing protein [Chthonomonadales bacterium]|nr:alcohol dehydrogenase catalytic domain-containing protein [Chthonomonadales bacterium]
MSQQSEIPRTMQAVICHGPGDYRLGEVPTPLADSGEVVIKVEACGVCASDVKCFSGAPLFWGDSSRPAYVESPVVPGHEFVGRVVSMGPCCEPTGLKIGDRVLSEQIVPCWRCRSCRRGSYHLCVENRIYGFRQAVQGAMAEYMKFPAGALIHRVPEDLTVQQAALIEPLACSMHAVERSRMDLGDVVVIAGAGTLGLGMVAAARLRNPARLVALDRFDHRLSLARQIGADLALNVDRDDVESAVAEMTDGFGCDVFIEATGHPDAVNVGLRLLRKGGTFVEFSVMARETSTDWTIIGDSKELTIYGAHLGPGCYPKVIDYLARGMLRTEGIVTHEYPLDRFAEAFDLVHSGGNSIKVLLRP